MSYFTSKIPCTLNALRTRTKLAHIQSREHFLRNRIPSSRISNTYWPSANLILRRPKTLRSRFMLTSVSIASLFWGALRPGTSFLPVEYGRIETLRTPVALRKGWLQTSSETARNRIGRSIRIPQDQRSEFVLAGFGFRRASEIFPQRLESRSAVPAQDLVFSSASQSSFSAWTDLTLTFSLPGCSSTMRSSKR